MEKIFEMQNTEMEKALGIREKTISDYRKFFKISKNELFAAIKGYKSQDPSVTIPGAILGLPVIIATKAFYDLPHIKNVYIEDGVTGIENSAFEKCTNLESIVIPRSVTTLGVCAFYGCFHLQQITIPGTISNISSWAFSGCSMLESVTIEEGVENISWSAFHKCQQLQSIVIPASVTHIDVQVFYECKKLTIYAPEDSQAEIYAKNNHIKFQAI